MGQTGKRNIRLVVEDEKTLYTPFSPGDEFTEPVKAYIRSKIPDLDPNESISLTVVSKEPVNEERFRSAVSNWVKDERKVFRREEKNTVRMLFGLLFVGSILIILSLMLEKHIDVLKYSLLPIMGSFALSNAASILIIDMPTVKAKRWMLNELEKKNMITFECNSDIRAERIS